MDPQLTFGHDKLSCELKGHLLAGISGGADSVFLFSLLMNAAREGKLTFDVVHVNHGIRGEASDCDEQFVRELCDRNGIAFHLFRACLGTEADEGSAREARYRFFRKCMEETGADALVLAHHLDDQAETFMLHLVRGAGPEGLGGMAPVSTRCGMTILRPLLGLRRNEIRRELSERGITWREDESNADPRYARNALRNGVMDELEQKFPGAAVRIARTAETIRRENEAQDAVADRFLNSHSGKDWLETDELMQLPEAQRRRILRKWWSSSFADGLDERALSYENTLSLDTLVMKNDPGKVNLPAGLVAVRGHRHLHITGYRLRETEVIPFEFQNIRSGDLTLNVKDSAGHFGNGTDCQEFPESFLAGTVIRTRQPGDRIRPFGMTGGQKIQDYLVNRKIDEPWRDRIPMLCRENEVLWVAGVGTGHIPAWNENENNIRLQWEGKMPWIIRKEAK